MPGPVDSAGPVFLPAPSGRVRRVACPHPALHRPLPLVTTQTPALTPSSLPNRPWRRADWLALLLVIGAAVAAARWLWQAGLPNQIDLLMSVYRITELQDAWQQGIFFPRWGLNLNFGYGALLFNFYPPLVSYVGLALRELGFGLLTTTKLILTLQLVAGGVGVYVYACRLLGGVLPAAVAGALYALSPYFLTVLYERGAMAEGMALALLPWLFWAAHSLLASGRRRDLLLTAALVAAMMMAHNITALFVVPGVALYVALLALIERRLRALLPVAGAFALGLGLAAYYWLPAITEIGATRADEYMLSGGIALRNFVVPLGQIVQRTPVHLYAGDSRFAFALWPFVVGLLGTLALLVRRPGRAPLALLAAAWAVILLLQANFSLPLWEGAPLIRFIQFPWRLYGPASLCVALLGGSLFTLRPLRGRWGWAVAVAGTLALFLLSTQNLRPALLPFWYDVDEAGINQADLWQRGRDGFPLFSDYAPATQRLVSKGIPLSRPLRSIRNCRPSRRPSGWLWPRKGRNPLCSMQALLRRGRCGCTTSTSPAGRCVWTAHPWRPAPMACSALWVRTFPPAITALRRTSAIRLCVARETLLQWCRWALCWLCSLTRAAGGCAWQLWRWPLRRSGCW